MGHPLLLHNLPSRERSPPSRILSHYSSDDNGLYWHYSCFHHNADFGLHNILHPNEFSGKLPPGQDRSHPSCKFSILMTLDSHRWGYFNNWSLAEIISRNQWKFLYLDHYRIISCGIRTAFHDQCPSKASIRLVWRFWTSPGYNSRRHGFSDRRYFCIFAAVNVCPWPLNWRRVDRWTETVDQKSDLQLYLLAICNNNSLVDPNSISDSKSAQEPAFVRKPEIIFRKIAEESEQNNGSSLKRDMSRLFSNHKFVLLTIAFSCDLAIY